MLLLVNFPVYNKCMKKILLTVGVSAVILVAALYALNTYIYNEKQAPVVASFKDAEYQIDGTSIRLVDGSAETPAAPDSSSKTTTQYFGGDYEIDLNNDGLEDIVFVITHETGGTGTFYYAVAALKTEAGYVGSDGYFLGDKVAIESIELSPNPRHKEVVVVNYVDRAQSEPMTIEPSVRKSVYLKLDVPNMMWGIVEPNFEGESR